MSTAGVAILVSSAVGGPSASMVGSEHNAAFVGGVPSVCTIVARVGAQSVRRRVAKDIIVTISYVSTNEGV